MKIAYSQNRKENIRRKREKVVGWRQVLGKGQQDESVLYSIFNISLHRSHKS
jgi:hypothetical protein